MSWNTKHVEANNCNVRHVRKNNEVDLMFHLYTCSSSSTKFSHTSFAASTFEIAPRTDRTAQPAPSSNVTGGKLHTTHHTFAKSIWQGQTQMKQRTLLDQREKKCNVFWHGYYIVVQQRCFVQILQQTEHLPDELVALPRVYFAHHFFKCTRK